LAAYMPYCTVNEDLNWVSSLISLTRAFREILFEIADPRLQTILEYNLHTEITTINEALAKGPRSRLALRRVPGKPQGFARETSPPDVPLLALLAEWMCDYLEHFSDRIDLGACIECGKIFPRQRRDNAYCSRTCQNRVAYKRRKIFESGL